MLTTTKLHVHNIAAKPTHLYDNEVWVMNKKGEKKTDAVQMIFLRPLLGYSTLDHQSNVKN